MPNSKYKPDEDSIVFWIHDEAMLEIKPNGDFLVHGRKAATDIEVYQVFKKWMGVWIKNNK